MASTKGRDPSLSQKLNPTARFEVYFFVKAFLHKVMGSEWLRLGIGVAASGVAILLVANQVDWSRVAMSTGYVRTV